MNDEFYFRNQQKLGTCLEQVLGESDSGGQVLPNFAVLSSVSVRLTELLDDVGHWYVVEGGGRRPSPNLS